MAPPRALARVPPEHGEEPEYLDREEREREHLTRAGQPAREHGGRHQRGVGAQAGGDVLARGGLGGRRRGRAVVEEEDVDGEEQEGHGPDAVAGGGPGEGFQDR